MISFLTFVIVISEDRVQWLQKLISWRMLRNWPCME